jgi:hypothetical protein
LAPSRRRSDSEEGQETNPPAHIYRYTMYSGNRPDIVHGKLLLGISSGVVLNRGLLAESSTGTTAERRVSEQNYSQLRRLALRMFSVRRASVVNHNDSVGGLSKLRAGEKLTSVPNIDEEMSLPRGAESLDYSNLTSPFLSTYAAVLCFKQRARGICGALV